MTQRSGAVVGLALALALVAACDRSGGGAPREPVPAVPGDATPQLGPEPAEVWSEAWITWQRRRYLEDGGARRAALEASLVNPANMYSAQRLAAYGLDVRGWDALPVWNPRSQPITAEIAAALERGEAPRLPAGRKPLWDGVAPATQAGWVELGRRVFFEYPMRAEVFAEWGFTHRATFDAIGVERTAAGGVPGLVVFANVDGKTRVGITCAVCHSTVRDGQLVAGAARRTFDYGRLRIAYFDETRAFVEPELARRMAKWGPGRADVTEDNDEDPVAIPDLWGLRAQTSLTQAGTIKHASPLALAIRQETQLLHSNHQLVRPPRELAWALAMYVYSLEPPPRAPPKHPERLARGGELFATHCRGCHGNAAHGGRTIAATAIGTDLALANGLARGTGLYRVPGLLDVARGAPYLHHGVVASLDELLSPARLRADYTRGRTPGPIPGHLAGTDLSAPDRAALVTYLETL
ncbi:MAG: hypothetical protein KF773_41240 [Deltaproteobacteria bacterium]|nr:hypothetical protein [Deltaproteobacteria bacterium]